MPAGNRGYYLKNEGVLLNQALINCALQFGYRRGFKPVHTPFFMQASAGWSGCGLQGSPAARWPCCRVAPCCSAFNSCFGCCCLCWLVWPLLHLLLRAFVASASTLVVPAVAPPLPGRRRLRLLLHLPQQLLFGSPLIACAWPQKAIMLQGLLLSALQCTVSNAWPVIAPSLLPQKAIMAECAQLSQFDEELYKVTGALL